MMSEAVAIRNSWDPGVFPLRASFFHSHSDQHRFRIGIEEKTFRGETVATLQFCTRLGPHMKDVDLLRYIKLGFYAARGRYAPAQLVILDLGSEGTGTGANSDCIFHHGGAATTALHLMF